MGSHTAQPCPTSVTNLILLLQERLKAAEAKRIEKERTEKYNKLKTDAKDARAKYREKYKLPESPPRSDAEEESEDEDEEDGFGPSKKVEQDPMDQAKALAEKAMSDPMGAATQSLDKIKFW